MCAFTLTVPVCCRVDRTLMRVEDISLRENSIKLYLQNIDARLVKLEEVVHQTAQVARDLQQALGFTRSNDRPWFNPAPSFVPRSALKKRPPNRFMSMPAGTDAGVPLPTWMTMAAGSEGKNTEMSGVENLTGDVSGVQGMQSKTEGGGQLDGCTQNLSFDFGSRVSRRPSSFSRNSVSSSGERVALASSLQNAGTSKKPNYGFIVPGKSARYNWLMNRSSGLEGDESGNGPTQPYLGSAVPSVDVAPLQLPLVPIVNVTDCDDLQSKQSVVHLKMRASDQSDKYVKYARNGAEQEAHVAEDELASDDEAELETTQLLLSDMELDEQRTHRSTKASELCPEQQDLGEDVLRLKQIPSDNKLLLRRLLDSQKLVRKDI